MEKESLATIFILVGKFYMDLTFESSDNMSLTNLAMIVHVTTHHQSMWRLVNDSRGSPHNCSTCFFMFGSHDIEKLVQRVLIMVS